MISVVITTHLALDKYLQRCLDSVMWQLSAEDEVLVVGDRYEPQGNRITTENLRFCTVMEAGVSAARNFGILAARGDWIKFMDVDDLLFPFALNAFRSVRAKAEVDSGLAVIGGAQLKIHNGLAAGLTQSGNVEMFIRRQNPLLVSVAFVRRSAALAVDGFDERIEFEEDWDFWLRLYSKGFKFATITHPVCCYWIDDEERAAKQRNHLVEGVDVREFLRRKYNLPETHVL